jgi:hypothetical protein
VLCGLTTEFKIGAICLFKHHNLKNINRDKSLQVHNTGMTSTKTVLVDAKANGYDPELTPSSSHLYKLPS